MSRLMLLVGVLQGWALWGLWKARELKVWPSLDPLSERTLLYISLALPLAFYLTENIEALTRGRRTKILVFITILFASLGAYSGWADSTQINPLGGVWDLPPARPSDLFAATVLGFILIPLTAHYEIAGRRWSYHALFETAWRNALMFSSSVALTGVFWIVLFAGTMLMKSIGINWVQELIEKAIFSIPVTGMVFGSAFALSLARAEWITTIRRFWLSISAWLLPLLLTFSVMWVIALPFTGLQPLLKTHNTGFILLWFIALSIKFANTAYQGGAGEEPYGRTLSKVLEYAWPSLIVLAAIAWWAMKLRVDQYGWTEDRVWAVFILFLATIYTLGYAYSLRYRQGWLANIGKTNILAAILMAVGLTLLLSPIADARRIAVGSQISRLMHNKVDAGKIDYAYLRWQAGRYGQEALNKLAAGIQHEDKDIIASKASQALGQKNRYGMNEGTEKLSMEQIRARFHTLPRGEAIDDTLFKAMQSGSRWDEERCMGMDTECLVWMIDLNGDGLKEAVVMIEKPEWSAGTAILYEQTADRGYRYSGHLNLRQGLDAKQFGQLKVDIELGKAKTLPPQFSDIEINGKRFSVVTE